MAVSDDIGARGEALFFIMLTRFCGRRRPFFRPHFLGEKFVTLDYIVELIDSGPTTPFFFVQVKTTTQGYVRDRVGNKRLKVHVSHTDVQRLISYPAPTYVVGIDEIAEVGYIVSANHGSPAHISSLPTGFLLDCDNLERLWHEVKAFWEDTTGEPLIGATWRAELASLLHDFGVSFGPWRGSGSREMSI